ncbi:hypothetical protein B0H19DRAFT_1159395 [Mycena capillaripes]|nr:hypothetical protein B0H19DRAFT_1159395 [Mycena capillaripes]
MVESSLSNWDGSQSPKKTKPPVPSQSTSSNSLVAIARPHPATASSSSAKDVDLEQQNRVEVSQKSTQSNADEKQKQTSLYPTSKLAPSSVMAMGAATLPAPQKSPLLPSLPLHFDAPSLALGPALHPSSPSATAPFGPPRAPSELNYSIGFGAPGPALRVPSTSLSSLSALSIPALDSISSKPPTPKSTSSSSASSRKLPQTSASAQRHPSRSLRRVQARGRGGLMA